ncbi:MAG: hypothetical protein ACJAVF_004482, partial [Paraglaciecola sp.]
TQITNNQHYIYIYILEPKININILLYF